MTPFPWRSKEESSIPPIRHYRHHADSSFHKLVFSSTFTQRVVLYTLPKLTLQQLNHIPTLQIYPTQRVHTLQSIQVLTNQPGTITCFIQEIETTSSNVSLSIQITLSNRDIIV